MTKSQTRPVQAQRSPLTLLATTALATSNLIVGILQDNTVLIAASAILAALFAAIYLLRIHRPSLFAQLGKGRGAAKLGYGRKLPLWIFAAILFIALPALFVLMRYLQPAA